MVQIFTENCPTNCSWFAHFGMNSTAAQCPGIVNQTFNGGSTISSISFEANAYTIFAPPIQLKHTVRALTMIQRGFYFKLLYRSYLIIYRIPIGSHTRSPFTFNPMCHFSFKIILWLYFQHRTKSLKSPQLNRKYSQSDANSMLIFFPRIFLVSCLSVEGT